MLAVRFSKVLISMTSILSLFDFRGRQAEAVGLTADRSADRPTVVTAGAGSGKTLTLVGRYVRLLEQDVPLRAIAAITFTEKAAREMRTRIRQTVDTWIARCTGEERTRWQGLAADLDAARVGTIHGLCTTLLRGHPAEAGLDPEFVVLDENQSARLQSEALEVALAWTAADHDAVQIFAALSEQTVRDLLAAWLAARSDTLAAFTRLGGDPLTIWSAALQRWLSEQFQQPTWLNPLHELVSIKAKNVSDKLDIQRQAAVQAADRARQALKSGEWSAVLEQLTTLRSNLKTNVGAKGNWAEGDLDSLKLAMKDLAAFLDGSFAALVDRKRPVSWELDRLAAELLPQLHRVFDQAAQEYQRLKDQARAVDFDDLEQGAARLLATQAEVRAYWQAEIQAVLVDEFQDTNERQREIVYQLTGFQPGQPGSGRGLFVVGDAKQSIYRFRGADVQVFQRVQADIAQSGGATIDLDLTFRAHQPLTKALNDLLEPILGTTATQPFEVPFAPLTAYRTTAPETLNAPYVELRLGLGDDAANGRQIAAAALAQRLREVHDREGVNWGQMALLFRASSGFAAYEDALERAGIPYVTVAGQGFYDRPEVRDLLNALHAIDDPADDLALAGFLRSPALGLSDAALLQLRWAADGQPRSIWAALQDPTPDLSSADTARAVSARELIAELHLQAGRTPVATLLKRLLDATHYRAVVRHVTGGERSRRNIDKLLRDAQRSELVGVNDFLDYVTALRDIAAREGEAPVEAGGAVQLMTVHKAKGLEFPLTVIADAAHQRRSAKAAWLFDDAFGLTLDVEQSDVHNVAQRVAALRQAQQEAAEDRRLLYVAATRAKDRLVISAHTKRRTDDTLALEGWLKTIGAVVGLEEAVSDAWVSQLPAIECVVVPEMLETALEPIVVERSDISFPQLDLVTPLEGGVPSPLELSQPDRVWRVVPRLDQPRAPAWVVGKLVHTAICRWRFPTDAGLDDLLQSALSESGLIDVRLTADALRRAKYLLQRFQTHPLYAELIMADRFHEVPVLVPATNEERVLDVLYRTDAGWRVLDFKTDHLPDDIRWQRVRDDYIAQVCEYQQAARQLLAQPVEAALVLLDFKQVIEVVDI
jgi:ATP-dependent helicase/nuclease subunit A